MKTFFTHIFIFNSLLWSVFALISPFSDSQHTPLESHCFISLSLQMEHSLLGDTDCAFYFVPWCYHRSRHFLGSVNASSRSGSLKVEDGMTKLTTWRWLTNTSGELRQVRSGNFGFLTFYFPLSKEENTYGRGGGGHVRRKTWMISSLWIKKLEIKDCF